MYFRTALGAVSSLALLAGAAVADALRPLEKGRVRVKAIAVANGGGRDHQIARP